MVKQVGDAWYREENRMIGADLRHYVTIRRGLLEPLKWTTGVASDTGVVIFGATRELVLSTPGAKHGAWTTAATKTQAASFPTSAILYGPFYWRHYKGGTITVKLRSAQTSTALSSAGYATMYNGRADRTKRASWFQIKITLDGTGASPTFWDFYGFRKSLLPSSEIHTYPVVESGVGNDLLSPYVGDAVLEVDNSRKQWDELYGGAYVRNQQYHNWDLELWTGFHYPDGNEEYLQLHSGKLSDVVIYQGNEGKHRARVTSKNMMLNQISDHLLGSRIGGGSLLPLYWGRRQKQVISQASPSSPSIYKIAGELGITSINNVYTRAASAHSWHVLNSSSYSVSTVDFYTKNVRLKFSPQPNILAVDVTFPGDHKTINLLKYILYSKVELGLGSWQVSTQTLAIASALRNRLIGARFSETPALEAINNVTRYMDLSVAVEGDRLVFVNPAQPNTTGITLRKHDYRGAVIRRDRDMLSNYAVIEGTENQLTTDSPQLATVSSPLSITQYGKLDLRRFYPLQFRSRDMVESFWATNMQTLGQTMLQRFARPREVVRLSGVSAKALRVEIGDKIDVALD